MHTNTKKQGKHKFSHSSTTHFEMYIFLFFFINAYIQSN